MADRRCDTLSMQMGEVLEAAMRQRQVSAYRLARTARLSENTIAHILDGHSARTSSLAVLAETLGLRWKVTLEWLPADPDAPASPEPRTSRYFRGAQPIPPAGLP